MSKVTHLVSGRAKTEIHSLLRLRAMFFFCPLLPWDSQKVQEEMGSPYEMLLITATEAITLWLLNNSAVETSQSV